MISSKNKIEENIFLKVNFFKSVKTGKTRNLFFHLWINKRKNKVSFYSGKIGITLNVGWSEPFDKFNPDDLETSDRDINFNLGWFAHAIYVNGDYPDVMKTNVRDKSLKQGYKKSRLPEFTQTEKMYINGENVFHHNFCLNTWKHMVTIEGKFLNFFVLFTAITKSGYLRSHTNYLRQRAERMYIRLNHFLAIFCNPCR